MARPFARRFYNSKAWKQCRDAYKQSVNGLCERCLKKGIYRPGEEVHHKICLSPDNINDPYITLSFQNLELLCSSCHSTEHNRKYKEVVRNGLKFDNFGNLVVDDG
jgi:5-methylcytosine-specific restriction enzyme A